MVVYNERILAIRNPYVRELFKHHWRQVHRNNFGYFGVYTGLPGHGKTESAMLHMWFQDLNFDEDTLKDKVITRPQDFLKGINEASRFEWILWMDAGLSTAISARNWQKITNTLVNDTTLLMRIKKMGVIFDSQMVGFIDKTTRSLFHWYTEVRRFETDPPVLKVHRIDVNQLRGDVYYPYPLLRVNGRTVKLTKITLKGRLPSGMLRKFDEVHMAAKEKILRQHYKTIEKIERKENPMDMWEMIEYCQNNIHEFTNQKGRVDISLIQLKMGLGRGHADQIYKYLLQEQLKGKTKKVKNTGL